MIHVVAIIKTKPGKREEVLDAALANLASVRAEKGCIEYTPIVDAEFGEFQTPIGDDSFIVSEEWQSDDCLRAHAKAPHMLEYAKKVGHLLESRTIHVLRAIG